MTTTYNAGIVTAYGAAVRGGYTGTYEEFCAQQAGYAQSAATVEQAREEVEELVESIPSDYSALSNDVDELKDGLEEVRREGGMSESFKQALHNLFENVSYINSDGKSLLDALDDAMYPETGITRINCVYTQSATIYDNTPLNSLRSDLVVTAHYSDGTEQNVNSYSLSGILSVGTSTITVTYMQKTTTFNVVVTASPEHIVADNNSLFIYSTSATITSENNSLMIA